MRLQILQLALAAVCSTAATAKIPFYIIHNAETPSFGRPGLTPVGKQRADCCIPNVRTAFPLAQSLGINIATCATGDGADDDCPSNTIKKFNKSSNQSVLIVWDSTDLEDLIENVDTDASLDNDSLGLHADLILSVNPAKLKSVGQSSMNCTGLDGTA
ncbi:hypothetical protein B0H14DRAFT_2891704 [Mycena olivaceomarginata]|nr:hypothetical protein B0H14DRAFT_2891704 [Mycena olivaceomarginata]